MLHEGTSDILDDPKTNLYLPTCFDGGGGGWVGRGLMGSDFSSVAESFWVVDQFSSVAECFWVVDQCCCCCLSYFSSVFLWLFIWLAHSRVSTRLFSWLFSIFSFCVASIFSFQRQQLEPQSMLFVWHLLYAFVMCLNWHFVCFLIGYFVCFLIGYHVLTSFVFFLINDHVSTSFVCFCITPWHLLCAFISLWHHVWAFLSLWCILTSCVSLHITVRHLAIICLLSCHVSVWHILRSFVCFCIHHGVFCVASPHVKTFLCACFHILPWRHSCAFSSIIDTFRVLPFHGCIGVLFLYVPFLDTAHRYDGNSSLLHLVVFIFYSAWY